MNKRVYIYLPIFFALTLVLGILLGTLLIPSIALKNKKLNFSIGAYDKVGEVMDYIENEYVDSVSFADLEQKAITGLLQSLDPHSVYIPSDEFAAANDLLKGRFDGIGVQFRLVRDSITVIHVISGGPSEKAGLLDGDRIVSIDGENVAGVKIREEDAIKKLKGPGGTRVKVQLVRRGHREIIEKTITRGVIPTYSIDIAFMPQRETGYIRLSKFSGTTAEEFSGALKKLKQQGMKKLILDLRGNGGGLLDAAVDLADEFLLGHRMIVYTEGFHRRKMEYFATRPGNFESGELVILIDEFSASASEILAGAIQDHDRGTIVGRRSFGKGLVQEQMQLPDKSAIRLTISRYYTPTGRSIQRKYSGNTEEYYLEFYRQVMDDDKLQDSLHFLDTTRYVTAGGKIVYGGGGIMPDIYVPAKTEYPSPLCRKLLIKGLFNNFGFDYADRHRYQLRQYRDPAGFIRDFQVSQALMKEFLEYASKQGITAGTEEFQQSESFIRLQLKGYIGRNVFSEEAFYPVILTADKMFQQALEVLAKPPAE